MSNGKPPRIEGVQITNVVLPKGAGGNEAKAIIEAAYDILVCRGAMTATVVAQVNGTELRVVIGRAEAAAWLYGAMGARMP